MARTPNPRDAIIGKAVRNIRLTRPRKTEGRRDFNRMTKGEAAYQLNQVLNKSTGQPQGKSDSYISQLERGEIRFNRARVRQVARALECTRTERAVLEELGGYEGFLRLLAHRLGIQVPNIRFLWDQLESEQLTHGELLHIVDEWLEAEATELKKRLISENAP